MKKLVIVAAVVAAFSTSTFANQCPTLVKKIDAAITTTQADDATKAKITQLRDQGQAQHDAGDHAASEASLNEALKLLGM